MPILRYCIGAVQKSQAQTIHPVLETQPTFRVGGFDVYGGKNLVPSTFPLHNSSFCLLISLRSTGFGHSTLRRAFSLASNFSKNCLVSVVDTPYCWNALAQPQAPSKSKIIAEIEKLSSEVWRRIDNVAKEFPHLNFERKTWDELCAETPKWMKDECEEAFNQNRGVAICLKEAAQSVFEGRTPSMDIDIAARFLVEELPVLCWLYYASPVQRIDLYPGQPFLFFRTLESGGFKTELPRISELAAGDRKFIHVDIRRIKHS